ncbi:MAG: hypothetical protein EP329_08905 [Deltaproteobacteria bacterium]|nr:MAG: hypothetical protein EP329_08905 [Deltaproteobacteria bacterium]
MTTDTKKSNYFLPDRSNRPSSSPADGTRELGTGHHGVLADGRPYVGEAAAVDGFTMAYYYFDATGLEDASVEELTDLLCRSGIDVGSHDPETGVYLGASRGEDAVGRPIIEFQVTYDLTDW